MTHALPSAHYGGVRLLLSVHHRLRLLAFALRYQGRKRVHNADEIMSDIVAKRLVDHLERAGFVVMKRAPIGGGAALGRGFEG